jgi:hypothetical protein
MFPQVASAIDFGCIGEHFVDEVGGPKAFGNAQ